MELQQRSKTVLPAPVFFCCLLFKCFPFYSRRDESLPHHTTSYCWNISQPEGIRHLTSTIRTERPLKLFFKTSIPFKHSSCALSVPFNYLYFFCSFPFPLIFSEFLEFFFFFLLRWVELFLITPLLLCLHFCTFKVRQWKYWRRRRRKKLPPQCLEKCRRQQQQHLLGTTDFFLLPFKIFFLSVAKIKWKTMKKKLENLTKFII